MQSDVNEKLNFSLLCDIKQSKSKFVSCKAKCVYFLIYFNIVSIYAIYNIYELIDLTLFTFFLFPQVHYL